MQIREILFQATDMHDFCLFLDKIWKVLTYYTPFYRKPSQKVSTLKYSPVFLVHRVYIPTTYPHPYDFVYRLRDGGIVVFPYEHFEMK